MSERNGRTVPKQMRVTNKEKNMKKELNISCVEGLTEETLETLKKFVANGFTAVRVRTGKSIDFGDGQLAFQIEGNHPELGDGIIFHNHDAWFERCQCEHCALAGESFFEYYSVYLGLKYVAREFPTLDVSVWVDSESFLWDAGDGFYFPGRFDCSEANEFMTELFELVRELRIVDAGDTKVFKNGDELGRSVDVYFRDMVQKTLEETEVAPS